MYQRPQASRNNKQLNPVDSNSAYFTHIEPPSSPLTTTMAGYQSYNGYGGRYGAGGVQSPSPSPPASSFTKPPQTYNHNHPPPPPSPVQHHAQSQYSADLTKPSRHRPGRSTRSGGGLSCVSVTLLLVVWTAAMAGGGYVWYTQYQRPEQQREVHHWQRKFETMEELNQELEVAQSKVPHELQQQITTLQDKLRTVTQQEGGARHQIQQLQTRLQQAQQETRTLEKTVETVKREAAQQVPQLHKAIQEQSKQLVLQKYGKGPYRVEFEVQFPQDDHSLYFLIELAPLETMPHAIHLFLEQVRAQLFDNGGFSFHHNGGHILFGSPHPNFLTTSPQDLKNPKKVQHAEDYLKKRFQQQGHNNLLFTEYSADFPHVQYTMAFAGRPGGPSMYINTVDNAQLHGPNGYSQDGLGDPCFGKVINGIDVIQRMHSSSKGALQHDSWLEMEHGPIAVKSAKLLNKDHT